jgi:hyaluronan synthase
MTSVDLLVRLLGVVFAIYTGLAATHFVVQLIFANRTYRQQARPAFAGAYPPNALAVDVVVPVYNESLDDLVACTESILAQRHLGRVNLIVVDDGSLNRAELTPLYDGLRLRGATVILASRNAGKRGAQYLGFQALTGDIVVTVDSDTRLAPDAVAMITRQFSDPRVGGVTGDVRVTNAGRNLLTRLIGLRYWMAFHQERAAQSWFRRVLCCSGPLSAYRRNVIDRVMDRYIAQSFRGRTCTYGDDRHLTNLVLADGNDTLFDSGARATTNVPFAIRQYLRQQLRWNKSFYRELLWTLPMFGRLPIYIRFDLVVQTILPVLMSLSVLTALVYSVLFSTEHLLRYALFVAALALLRSTYGAIRERRPAFLLFVLYGFVHVTLLVPLRAVALMTLSDNRWGTR